jgi:Tfp pilus assembly protein PilF
VSYIIALVPSLLASSIASSTMTDNSKAAQLKDEGNNFFAQQDYVQAFTKYSDAITEDATNAILFANRAACSLAMNK